MASTVSQLFTLGEHFGISLWETEEGGQQGSAVFLCVYEQCTHMSLSACTSGVCAPGVLPIWTCFPLGSPGDSEDGCPVADSCMCNMTSQQVLPRRPQAQVACELTGRH